MTLPVKNDIYSNSQNNIKFDIYFLYFLLIATRLRSDRNRVAVW